MSQFDVAYIREQGQDMIIVPLDITYAYKSQSEKNNIRATLQRHATAAGLVGTVVTVWDAGAGRMGFLAPHQWSGFFSNLTLPLVLRNVNKTLTCS